MEIKGFFQFEIIMNVLVRSFRFISLLWVSDHYNLCVFFFFFFFIYIEGAFRLSRYVSMCLKLILTLNALLQHDIFLFGSMQVLKWLNYSKQIANSAIEWKGEQTVGLKGSVFRYLITTWSLTAPVVKYFYTTGMLSEFVGERCILINWFCMMLKGQWQMKWNGF